MEITPSTLRSLDRGFSAIYREGYQQTETWWNKLATEIPSTKSENAYGWMTKLPRMREWLGPRVLHALSAHSYTITNKDWELTIEVDRNHIEDDNLGIYNPLMSAMGESARKHPEDLLLTALENGTSTTCYDGQYFFDTDHPIDASSTSSGTQANLITSSALSSTNLKTARAAMMKFKGEDGKPMGIRPNLLVVPPALEVTAREIVTAATVSTGGTNVMSQLGLDVQVIDELTSDTSWYLLDTRKVIKPFVFQNRKAPQFISRFNPDSDVVFNEKKFQFGVDCRDNAGYALWFLALKCEA